MKYNILKILLILFIISNYALAQEFRCGGVVDGIEGGTIKDNKRTSGVIANAYLYTPNANTPIKYVRVNVHFCLYEKSHPSYPGNFTKKNDGRGNTNITGYDVASDLINGVNDRMKNGRKLSIPPNNTLPALSPKIQYVLNGVFFHEDNSIYPYVHGIYSTAKKNAGEAINVFFLGESNVKGDAVANMGGDRYVNINGFWNSYNSNTSNYDNQRWVLYGSIAHEIGHNLSLLHTMLTSLGSCSASHDDYCSDTPTINDMINNFNYNSCNCGWDGTDYRCSNNLMDYHKTQGALSPLQLGRMHWTLQNEMLSYQLCKSKSLNTSITSFTENKAVIAKYVSIPSYSSIKVSDNNALYVNANEFEVNGQLEITLGSTLDVKLLCP